MKPTIPDAVLDGHSAEDFTTSTQRVKAARSELLKNKRAADARASHCQTVDVTRCRVIVSGRVQGVWYRESCRREAVTLGVAGWVRNNRDGTVEAVLEGDTASVEKLLAWMRIGPPHAHVTTVEAYEEPAAGERTFTVL